MSALTKLMTEHWTSFTDEEKLDIRAYILNYLATRGVELEQFVVAALVKLLCRVTKLGWFDEGALPEVTAGEEWWGPLAFAAVRGEPVNVRFEAPRDPVWRSGPDIAP